MHQVDAWHQSLGYCVLCWLATVDAQGQPHVSPKEVFAVFDEQHLVIAHIASPTSVKNVLQNHKVCVSLIDVFVQKGWKLLGRAQYVHSSDAVFSGYAKPLLPMAGDQFNIQGVFLVTVEQAHPIIAPSYRFFSRHHHGASANRGGDEDLWCCAESLVCFVRLLRRYAPRNDVSSQ